MALTNATASVTSVPSTKTRSIGLSVAPASAQVALAIPIGIQSQCHVRVKIWLNGAVCRPGSLTYRPRAKSILRAKNGPASIWLLRFRMDRAELEQRLAEANA
jgi:hypothetical protein